MSQRETFPAPGHLDPLYRFHTLPRPSPGRRRTAILLALLSGPIAGLLCVLLAHSLLAGASGWLQAAVFVVVGFATGSAVLGALATVDAGDR
ncbi:MULTISPECIES: hypothetical protein [Polymorphospora]|uniref:Uncharacterized protein n=1 Tax=Polymorphospora lycopeni TaxID=3140240 RepID=A0ABV5CVD3_9ACTN